MDTLLPRFSALDRFHELRPEQGTMSGSRPKDEIARYVMANRASTPVMIGSPSVTGMPGTDNLKKETRVR